MSQVFFDLVPRLLEGPIYIDLSRDGEWLHLRPSYRRWPVIESW
jgi:hypothetical protein